MPHRKKLQTTVSGIYTCAARAADFGRSLEKQRSNVFLHSLAKEQVYGMTLLDTLPKPFSIAVTRWRTELKQCCKNAEK
jgi:hypothetical protein